MLILLPPSETKVSGGGAASLRLETLRFGELTPLRSRALDALAALSADEDAAARALKVGPKSRAEIAANLHLLESATMPAIDRYTGVLYDALDSASLDAAKREWAARHVAIHSATFGPIGAGDLIPTYRMSAGVRLAELGPYNAFWSAAVSSAIADAGEFVLDLRSASYQAAGPVPAGTVSAAPTVVAEQADGAVRALNHFNKRAKGLFVRRLIEQRPQIETLDDLLEWSAGSHAGLRVRHAQVELVAETAA